jgi:hypothetical protein
LLIVNGMLTPRCTAIRNDASFHFVPLAIVPKEPILRIREELGYHESVAIDEGI